MTPGDTWVSFFFPLGFPDLETGSGVSVIRMGAGRTVGPHCVIFFPRSAFRIWKQVRATQGGADPTVSSFFLPLDFCDVNTLPIRNWVLFFFKYSYLLKTFTFSEHQGKSISLNRVKLQDLSVKIKGHKR